MGETQIDMSAAAVTARLELACGLGDVERLATMIRHVMDEMKSESQPSKEPGNKKKDKDARIRS